MTPSIVFDFDGTLALGHGPIRAYAQAVAPAIGGDFLARVDDELRRYDEGESDRRDGYDVVGTMATEAGLDAAAMQNAYAASREALGTDDGPVSTIDDLDGFLATLSRNARLVLATNAPETGIDRLLDAWGVRERFDEMHFTVGKPAGLTALIERLLADGPVLSVGDIAVNDLVPARELGADTALVGATAFTNPTPVTMRGESLAELRDDIETWVVNAAARPVENNPKNLER